jgi:hypothetical protein
MARLRSLVPVAGSGAPGSVKDRVGTEVTLAKKLAKIPMVLWMTLEYHRNLCEASCLQMDVAWRG